MKKPFLLYSLVSLFATGTLTGLLLLNRTQAQSPANPHHQENKCGMGKMNQQKNDQHYILMMISHHQGAIDMADLALNKSKHPEIIQLAQEITKAQTQEIEKMKNWYKQWYGAEVLSHSNLEMSTNANGCGMMSMRSTNLEIFKKTSYFDKVFIEEMIPHHQEAVEMSAMVLNSEHSELRNLAKNIIQTQTLEIEQMRQWLDMWY